MDVGHLALITLGAAACLWISRRSYRQRRALEAKLEEERLFMSTVLDSIHDGIAVCDADGVLNLFNRAMSDMHGLPQQAVASRDWAEKYDLYKRDGKTPMSESDIPLARALAGEVVKDETMVIAPAGCEPITALANSRAMIAPDGRKLGAVVSMHDVTEELRARDESRQVHQIIETSPNIVFKLKVDSDWTIEYISDNVRQLGYTAEDFLEGRVTCPGIIHPDDLERMNAEVAHHVAAGSEHCLLSFRIIDNLGCDRWVETWLVIIRDVDGMVSHHHGIIVDVTDREMISKMLRDSEERMELALLGADLGMWDFDLPSGRGVYNERWCKMLGLDVAKVPNHVSSWESLIHPDDDARVMTALQAHLNGETPSYEAEYRLHHSDGHWVWVLDRGCVTSRDDDGVALRMSGTHLDITLRKTAAEEARVLEAQMQQAQKLESLGMLAGGIAHDFNNILMAILGNAELARLDLEDDVAINDHIDEIESAAGRAADLCNQMLAYSGKGRFNVCNVDLTAEIQAISRMLSVGISKKIDLRFELEANLPSVRADISQLRQVVMNLITNASEAIGNETGVISVRTSVIEGGGCQEASPCTESSKGCDGCCLVLEVSDTGCGMDEVTRERLFEPFYSTKAEGRGLGMAAVIGIVNSHGGTIGIDSEPGAGTRVSLCLPCEQVPVVSHSSENDVAVTRRPATGTILIADDEGTVLRLGERLLKSLGWDVVTADDGMTALDVVESGADDIGCVILDVTMPRMGGIEARRRILELRPDLPVILCSGYHGTEIASLTEADVPFIQKPYRRRELARVIEKATTVMI